MRRSGDKFFETECYVVIQFEPSLSASGGEGAALYRETLRSNFMITDKIHKIIIDELLRFEVLVPHYSTPNARKAINSQASDRKSIIHLP